MTGAAVLGGKNKNTDRTDAQSVFLTGMVDLLLRGINSDSTYPHQKNIPAGQTTVGNIWWGMVDLPLRGALLITNQLLYQLSYTSISISAAYSNRTFGVCQHIFYARNEGE